MGKVKKDLQHKPPKPQKDQDAAWAKVVKALKPGASDDDLPDGDDLPDDPEGHLAMGLERD